MLFRYIDSKLYKMGITTQRKNETTTSLSFSFTFGYTILDESFVGKLIGFAHTMLVVSTYSIEWIVNRKDVLYKKQLC